MSVEVFRLNGRLLGDGYIGRYSSLSIRVWRKTVGSLKAEERIGKMENRKLKMEDGNGLFMLMAGNRLGEKRGPPLKTARVGHPGWFECCQ
jgi:hypothetical protein